MQHAFQHFLLHVPRQRQLHPVEAGVLVGAQASAPNIGLYGQLGGDLPF
jgi:hypothetical protein